MQLRLGYNISWIKNTKNRFTQIILFLNWLYKLEYLVKNFIGVF